MEEYKSLVGEYVDGCDCDFVHEGDVARVSEELPPEDLLYDVSDFFKILGDSTRIRILFALDRAELCVCDLACLLSMTKSAISHQLRILRTSSLVRARRSGKNVFYSLADDHIRDIIEKALEHISE